MDRTLSEIDIWIKKMMEKKGISNYKIDIQGNSSKGDGYLGEITFIKVIAIIENNREKIYNLVIKSAKTSDEFRKQTPLKEAFNREILLYSKVFPIFREFQEECSIENYFNKFAKCYSVCSDDKLEALVLENLKTIGFDIHDRQVVQNLNHTLYVFQNYGKFHAISLALKTRKPALFRSLTKNMSDVMGIFISQAKMVPGFIDNFKVILEELRSRGKVDIAEKYQGWDNNIEEYITKFTNPNDMQSVILHGDCWNNNMMFKYEGENKHQPTDMRFIDFQLSRVASPVFDLSYYLYCCTDRTVLQNFHFLLQAYYSSLSDSLKEMGCNCEEIITFKELKNHWRKYGRYGLALAPFIAKIVLCQSDEALDFAESAEKGEFMESFDFQLQDEKSYKDRLVDVFTHFAQEFL